MTLFLRWLACILCRQLVLRASLLLEMINARLMFDPPLRSLISFSDVFDFAVFHRL